MQYFVQQPNLHLAGYGYNFKEETPPEKNPYDFNGKSHVLLHFPNRCSALFRWRKSWPKMGRAIIFEFSRASRAFSSSKAAIFGAGLGPQNFGLFLLSLFQVHRSVTRSAFS